MFALSLFPKKRLFQFSNFIRSSRHYFQNISYLSWLNLGFVFLGLHSMSAPRSLLSALWGETRISGCLAQLLWHLQASEAEGGQNWVLESPTCSTSSSDSQGTPSGCLLLGLVWNRIVLGEEGLRFLAPDHFRVTAALMFSMQGFIPAVWMQHYQVEVCFKRRKWDFFWEDAFQFFFFKVISTFRYRLRNNKPSVSCQK